MMTGPEIIAVVQGCLGARVALGATWKTTSKPQNRKEGGSVMADIKPLHEWPSPVQVAQLVNACRGVPEAMNIARRLAFAFDQLQELVARFSAALEYMADYSESIDARRCEAGWTIENWYESPVVDIVSPALLEAVEQHMKAAEAAKETK